MPSMSWSVFSSRSSVALGRNTAQSSPMPRMTPRPFPLNPRRRSTSASSFMKDETRRQILAEDPAHGGEMILRLAIQFEIGERPANHAQSGRRQIARGIARVARERTNRIAGFRNFEELLDPARDYRRRKDLIDRAVEQLSRAQSRDAPQAGVDEVARKNTRHQLIAQLRLGLDRQQLQAGGGAPHFPQQARIHARTLGPARQQNR